MQNIENNFQKYNYKCMLILLLSINDIPIFLTILFIIKCFCSISRDNAPKKIITFSPT